MASSLLLAAAVSELTSRHHLEVALREQASHALTGLPNRAQMQEALTRALGPAVGVAGP